MDPNQRRVYVRRISIGGPAPQPQGFVPRVVQALKMAAIVALALLIVALSLPLFLLLAVVGSIVAAYWRRRLNRMRDEWMAGPPSMDGGDSLDGDYRVVDPDRSSQD